MKTIFYVGPQGSVNEKLVTQIFRENYHLVMCSVYRDVLENTHKIPGTIGVLAIENTINNDVHVDIEALKNNNFIIIGEATLTTKDLFPSVRHNLTRYIFVSTDYQKIPELGENENKITYLFELKHEPGSLANVLSALAKEHINLTRIQSRPIPGTEWQYEFWIDMEIPYSSKERINEILGANTLQYKLLGIYEKGRVYE